MDAESQKRFDEVTKMDADSLTPADADFIRARASYLSGDQREKFAEILGEQAAAPRRATGKKEAGE